MYLKRNKKQNKYKGLGRKDSRVKGFDTENRKLFNAELKNNT